VQEQTPILIAGSGGHAKVILDILETCGVEIAGFTGPQEEPRQILGHPLLGTDEQFPRLFASGIRFAFPAVGDNSIRQAVALKLAGHGFTLTNAISPRASVSRHARLGRGVAIMPHAVVNAGAEIGDGVIVNTSATVDHDCVVGAFSHIAPGTNLAGCVRVGEGSFLGVGTRVIPGISIGEWATVGAGSVVVRDVEDGRVVFGVPARVQNR
jgi:UDP-perosamine 4-acetyltransferase